MIPITPRPTFDVAQPIDFQRAALAMPFSPAREFMESVQSGIMQAPALGTAIRGAITPSGNEVPPLPTGNVLLDAINAPAAIRSGVEQFGRQITGQANPALTKTDYEASPWFRKAIPWDPGMTPDRAAALAQQHDIQMARAYMGDKYSWNLPFDLPLVGHRMPGAIDALGTFIGQGLDPTNYVPIFGEAALAAASARWGFQGLAKIGAATGLNAAEAATNVALMNVMTMAQRQKYGDDVSWQAQINEAAMGALLGAVLTPLVHGLGHTFLGGRRVVDRIRSTIENPKSAELGRAVMNDGAGSVIDTGKVELTPSSLEAVRQMSSDVANKRDAATALSRETQGLREQSAEPGKMVITPNGSRVVVRPEVVELSSLQPAQGALQVRDRSRAASDAQVDEIAHNLDPARLMPSVDADRGAPIVGADDTVDSGNGRVMAIKKAYDTYPEQAQGYRDALDAAGYKTEGMQQPVLIQRRITDLSPDARAQFNAEANTSGTARMSATETAAMDRGALDDGTLRMLNDGPVTSRDNRDFVARFLGNLPSNERAALVDEGGRLNADGQRRIENALVASAYGDVDAGVVSRFAEATDDNTRSVVGALSDVAGRWALMRRAMAAGELSPEYDVTPELTNALRALQRWREMARAEGRPVPTVIQEGMAQLDLIDGEMSLEAKALVRAFYKTDDFNRSAGRDVIAGRLGKIIDTTLELGRPSLFGDEIAAATKLGVIESANDNVTADLFPTDDARGGADEIGQGGILDAAGANRGNAAQGAQDGRPGGSIGARFAERVEAAGRSAEEARATGAVVEAFYHTQAERFGITPGELEARFPLPEVRAADAMPDAALAQVFPDIVEGDFTMPGGKAFTLHEAGHYFLHMFKSMAEGDNAPLAMKADLQHLRDWWASNAEEVAADSPAEGVTGADVMAVLRDGTSGDRVKDLAIDVGLQEQWARGFEAYMREGAPPSPGLAGVFEQFKKWLVAIYQKATDLKVNLSPEIRGVFDRLLADENKPSTDALSPSMPRAADNVAPPVVEHHTDPDELSAAALRVSSGPEDHKALREQFGLEDDGSFAEEDDIKLLAEQGQLSAGELAELEQMDQEIKNADAWGKALMTAARCAFRF